MFLSGKPGFLSGSDLQRFYQTFIVVAVIFVKWNGRRIGFWFLGFPAVVDFQSKSIENGLNICAPKQLKFCQLGKSI